MIKKSNKKEAAAFEFQYVNSPLPVFLQTCNMTVDKLMIIDMIEDMIMIIDIITNKIIDNNNSHDANDRRYDNDH